MLRKVRPLQSVTCPGLCDASSDSFSLLLQRLKEEGKVWCIHNASEKDDVLFPKDATPLITLSQDLVDFWHATKVRLASQALLAMAATAWADL